MHKDRSQCSSPFSEKKNLPGQQKLRSIAVFSFFRNSLFLQPDIGWIWAFFIPYLHNTTTLMKMEGGNPSVLSKFSSGKRNGSNTMHNFQSLFCAETGAGCGLVRLLAADGPGAFRHTSSCSRNLSRRSPSILLRKTVRSLKSPTGAFIAPLRCANANNALFALHKILHRLA